MIDDDLKRCPFCGSMNLNLYYRDVDSRGNPMKPVVRCNVCGIFVSFTDFICDGQYRTLDDIQKVWNKRVNE